MPGREVCTFVPIEDDGQTATRVEIDMTINTSGGPFIPLIDSLFVVPNARSQLLLELELMKERLEAEPPARAS